MKFLAGFLVGSLLTLPLSANSGWTWPKDVMTGTISADMADGSRMFWDIAYGNIKLTNSYTAKQWRGRMIDIMAPYEKDDQIRQRGMAAHVENSKEALIRFLKVLTPELMASVGYEGRDGRFHNLSYRDLCVEGGK